MSEPHLPTVFKAVLRPIQAFFALEAAGGIVLIIAVAQAMVWANSPFRDSYEAVFSFPLALELGPLGFHFTLHHLINDGLMTIFFLVVGMEIKRELAVGELSKFSQAVMPAIAALGGMVVPACIYLLFNAGKPSSNGWAIPMATDIAFAIGVLTLVKSRVSHALVVFLTALAIFDDIGGILVIALFYGSGLNLLWLGGAVLVTAALFVCNRLYVRSGLIWGLFGAALWLCLHYGGIHATISGVVLGLCIPAKAKKTPAEVLQDLKGHAARLRAERREEDVEAGELLQIGDTLVELEPPSYRFVHRLHPYVAFGIVPLFALANSGIFLGQMSAADLLEPVPLGVGLGLLLGKPLGIFFSSVLAVRLKISPMPGDTRPLQFFGMSVVAGIGFTVALFVASLAFPGSETLLIHAKLGILLGSFCSAVIGFLLLRFAPYKLPAPVPRATVKAS